MKKLLFFVFFITYPVFAMEHIRSFDALEIEAHYKRKKIKSDHQDKSCVKHTLPGRDTEKVINDRFLAAVIGNDSKKVAAFLDVGIDVNAKSKIDGMTALHFAAKNGCFDLLRQLLEAGADPNIENNHQELALHYLSVFKKNKRLDATELFVNYGAKIDQPDCDGVTPLVYAVLDGDADCVCYLLEKKACVTNALAGQYVMHLAAMQGYVSIIQLLVPYLSAGWLDALDWDDETPLHKAARFGKKDAVLKLLEFMPNPFIENENGKTPSEVALENDHEEIAQNIKMYEYLYILKKKLKCL